MTSEQATTSPVELRYTLTSADLREGVAAQLRGIRRGWLVALLTVPPLLGIVLGFVRSEAWDLPAAAVPIIAAAFLLVLLVAIGFGLLTYRLFRRWIHRWQAQLILRGNPWLSEPIRATVTATGIHASNAAGESRSSWSQYPLYVETDQSFVLLTSKRLGAMALVLPKRGLVEDDPARLRALLDTHCHRRA